MNPQDKQVSASLGVWLVLLSGALAIPVGLVGFRWLDRANTSRIGFSQRVSVDGVTVERGCTERSLVEHFGQRSVRTYDDALVVQIPALQYGITPERINLAIHGSQGGTQGRASVFQVDTAFYKERAVAARYDEVIASAMSEAIDVITRGCAQNDEQRVRASRWSAQCTAGPGFTRTCPTLRAGMTISADLRLPVRRN